MAATQRSFIATLVRKNFLLKRKSPKKWLVEVLLPVVWILVIGGLKSTSKEVYLSDGWDAKGLTYPLNIFEKDSYLGIDAYVQEGSMSAYLRYLGSGGLPYTLSNPDDTKTCREASDKGFVGATPSSLHPWPTVCETYVVPSILAIVPDTPFTREYFFKTLQTWYPRVPLDATGAYAIPAIVDVVQFYADEAALERYIQSTAYGSSFANPKVKAAIAFTKTPTTLGTPGSIEYSLRLNSTAMAQDSPSTTLDAYNPLQRNMDTNAMASLASNGFFTLQTLVARFATCVPDWNGQTTTGTCTTPKSASVTDATLDATLLQQVLQDKKLGYYALDAKFDNTSVPTASLEALLAPLRRFPQAVTGAHVTPFPMHHYTDRSFYTLVVHDYFSLLFVMSNLLLLSSVLTALIGEKETKSRELMKILGVPERAIVASWFLTYGVIFAISAVLQMAASQGILFGSSNPGIVFLFFLLFGYTIVAFGYMISAIFSSSRAGTYVGIIAFFAMYLVSTGLNATSSAGAKTAACLLSPVALTLGIHSLSTAEASSLGVSLTESSENFVFSTALGFFALDTVLYTLLGLYFEKVIPKEYGVVEPWYFFASPAYWRRAFGGAGPAAPPSPPTPLLTNQPHESTIEPVGADCRQQERDGDALQIQNLRKEFGNGKVAVHGLNLTLYKNQITCLLGHNGAGKTTLMSMLTGMIPTTSGDATIRGLRLSTDLNQIRASLGMCPQHDVLYGELTVHEHLAFYGQIKGFVGPELTAQVDQKITEVGLTEKRHAVANSLSGGQKRKLCLAIALLGDSSLVFLDEPTSGMDPYSRRSTWETIMNNRPNRIIVLTTHFMDEADILGDRIAIMAEGELRCCGSSLFLKNRYGAGYTFSLVKASSCNVDALTALVVSHVRGAKVLSNVGTEIAFQLPLDSAAAFAAMFQALEDDLSKWGVISYGISVTTMEEVFIKVAEVGDAHGNHTLQTTKTARRAEASDQMHDLSRPLTNSVKRRVSFLFSLHFGALFVKRLRTAKRDLRVVIFGALLPILFLILGFALVDKTVVSKNDPKLVLATTGMPYNGARVAFTCHSDWLCPALAAMSGAKDLGITQPAYPTTSPIVFNVPYANLTSVQATTLRAGDVIWGDHSEYGAYVAFGNATTNAFGYNVLVNTTAAFASAIYKASIDQALYQTIVGNSEVTLAVANYPLPIPPAAATDSSSQAVKSATTSIFVTLAFAFFTASVVPYLVHEKHPSHNAKHQQLVSGVSLPAFWMANFVWDLLVYVIPCACAIICIYGFGVTAMTGHECQTCPAGAFGAVIVLFVLTGPAIIAFCYIFSYVFTSPSGSQTYIILVNLLLGVVLVTISNILDALDDTKSINASLKYLWRVSPLFCLGNGLNRLNDLYTGMTESTVALGTSAFNVNVIGTDIAYVAVEAVVFPLVAVSIDYALSFPKFRARFHHDPRGESRNIVDMDEDVAAEAARVERGDAAHDAIVMRNLRKVYKTKTDKQGKVGLVGLSLALPKGECFGYLGINGAGKTSTMKILTGDVLPSEGNATLGGFDILAQQIEVRRLIGYCPQFDALIDKLTVREHLELFGAIKGVPAAARPEAVRAKMEQLNLLDFEDKLAGSLSGGNKRKLSVAIAMIGAPEIIFLDEPSTGMDPVSRRFMWDVIADISTQSKESTILLTTHSMEECEALCTRVGIMVGGALRCLGSIQHLKNRFGDGLMMHIKGSPISPADVHAMVQQHASDDVTREQLTALCQQLGHGHRADYISADHATGFTLAETLERQKSVSAAVFFAWWLGEDAFDAIAAFLTETFGQASLLERQNDVCRFKLSGSNDTLALSNVFAKVEAAKTALHIQEYTVSQTTLEQIFNSFASKQTQEKGVARGVEVAVVRG
ncbi:Aste57867_14286 [Aphanomyces stellatus]|uniref:Aste57867_14286 protein n=1 Tax=Aphanomyces stellatus TaxID=120398 RepID=A0A485L0K9_9STRA|nr:hypothetical protein As57867_014234 [Aphanomyces stellatus]VFT91111.1 Aste57867_14286 [Aphanomyces stellatus]